MSRSSLALAATTLSALLVAAGAALATSSIYVTDAEQAQRSTAVVIATVGPSRVVMSEEYQRPMTRTQLQVQEVLYGTAPAQVEIEQMGGTKDGVGTFVPGDARFEPGERCVLFLRQVEGGWYLTAMEQSKYLLQPSGRLGDVMKRTLSGGMFTRGDDGRLVAFEEPADRPLKLLRDFRALMTSLNPPEQR